MLPGINHCEEPKTKKTRKKTKQVTLCPECDEGSRHLSKKAKMCCLFKYRLRREKSMNPKKRNSQHISIWTLYCAEWESLHHYTKRILQQPGLHIVKWDRNSCWVDGPIILLRHFLARNCRGKRLEPYMKGNGKLYCICIFIYCYTYRR